MTKVMTETMLAYCPHCWATVPVKAQVCPACGAVIEGAEAGIVDKYIAALRHPQAETRLRAAWMLGRMREARAVTALLAVVAARGDDDPYLLSAVVKSLGQIGDEQAVPSLAGLLDEPGTSFMVRSAAMHALADIGGEEAWAALDKAADEVFSEGARRDAS
jgi:HEAT repeat protein